MADPLRPALAWAPRLYWWGMTAFVVGCCIFGLWRDRVMDRVVVGVMLIGLAVATMLFHDVATARLAALRAERENEDG